MRRAAAELQKRTEELEARVAEEEAALARARELRDALEARRDALAAQQRSGAGEGALAVQQRRNSELRAENTQLKRTLLRFLNRYYPRPAPQPSRTRGDDAPPVPMKTLREIVQVCGTTTTMTSAEEGQWVVITAFVCVCVCVRG